MNATHKFRRNLQRIGLKVYRLLTIQPYDNGNISEYEKETFGICHQLISNPNSTLLMSPISNKRYIKSEDEQIFIVIHTDAINIVNHTYSYDIKVANTPLYDRIVRVFDGELEARRTEMEMSMQQNVKHSLKQIYQNLANDK